MEMVLCVSVEQAGRPKRPGSETRLGCHLVRPVICDFGLASSLALECRPLVRIFEPEALWRFT